MNRAAVRPYLRYAASEPLRERKAGGTLSAWPRLASLVAAEQRGAKTKKKLEIDPLHADTVRLAFKLALEGDGTSGPMGIKTITKHLNERRIFTRDGGRCGIGTVHRMLTRAPYAGRHEFNKRGKSKELKPATEVIAVEVPAIIDQAMFDAMQAHLKRAAYAHAKPPRRVTTRMATCYMVRNPISKIARKGLPHDPPPTTGESYFSLSESPTRFLFHARCSRTAP